MVHPATRWTTESNRFCSDSSRASALNDATIDRQGAASAPTHRTGGYTGTGPGSCIN